MRLLLVEDKPGYAKDIERAVKGITGCELVWAASRDSALEKLGSEDFDLVLLDRSIPTSDGTLDDHQEHGWRVFEYVRDQLPGTPVWFLTATEDPDFAAEMTTDHSRNGDLHGRNLQEAMYAVWWKRKANECVARVRAFAAQRGVLDQIAVKIIAEMPELKLYDKNVLRMFGRRYSGVAVEVSPLGGGLSGSRVMKTVVRDAAGDPLMTAVAKVATLADVRDEAQRYNSGVTRLAPGGFPQLSLTIEVGAGNRGGLFYGMVGDTLQSLFERLAVSHAGVGTVPAEIREIERRWYQAKRVEDQRVAQIRRKFIGDTTMREIAPHLEGLDIARIEATNVQVRRCWQHGDLHCANVLFTEPEQGKAMLIDFGDVGESYSAVDPVTLELSTLFHKQRDKLGDGWPTIGHIEHWTETERFTDGCPFAAFIKGCRQWADAVAGSPEEVIAIAYAFAARQLKYEDTNKEWAKALIRCCARALAT